MEARRPGDGRVEPLQPGPALPDSVSAIIEKAATAWLKNTEVLGLLLGCREHGLPVCTAPPVQPPGENGLPGARIVCGACSAVLHRAGMPILRASQVSSSSAPG